MTMFYDSESIRAINLFCKEEKPDRLYTLNISDGVYTLTSEGLYKNTKDPSINLSIYEVIAKHNKVRTTPSYEGIRVKLLDTQLPPGAELSYLKWRLLVLSDNNYHLHYIGETDKPLSPPDIKNVEWGIEWMPERW